MVRILETGITKKKKNLFSLRLRLIGSAKFGATFNLSAKLFNLVTLVGSRTVVIFGTLKDDSL